MEKDYLWAMENFDAVWQRVRGETAPAPPESRESDETELLLTLLGEKYRQQRLLYGLAVRCRDSARRTLEQLAAEEKQQYRRLEMEYFLRTGQRHRPARSCPVSVGMLEGLRLAWQEEGRMRESLLAAAEVCPAPAGDMLQAMAAEDEGHAGRLYELIRRKMLV